MVTLYRHCLLEDACPARSPYWGISRGDTAGAAPGYGAGSTEQIVPRSLPAVTDLPFLHEAAVTVASISLKSELGWATLDDSLICGPSGRDQDAAELVNAWLKGSDVEQKVDGTVSHGHFGQRLRGPWPVPTLMKAASVSNGCRAGTRPILVRQRNSGLGATPIIDDLLSRA